MRPTRMMCRCATVIALAILSAPLAAQFEFDETTDVVDLTYPWDTDLVDLDEDGHLDMIVCLPELDASVAIYLGDGTGGFGIPTTYDLATWGEAADVGDLDGDGDLDVAVALSHTAFAISALINQGGGVFTVGPESALSHITRDIALGDLDGDGHLDAILPIWSPAGMIVMTGDGAGGFSNETVYPLDGGNSFGVELADLDGDGDLEAAVATYGSIAINGGLLQVFDNPGDGLFGTEASYAVHKGTWMVEAGDLDGDGDLDLFTTNRNVNSVSVFLNDGDGAFAPQLTTTVGGFPTDGHLADFDGDGDLDALVPSTQSLDVRLLENDGTGVLTDVLRIPTQGTHISCDVGDLDGDGQVDFVSGGGFGMNRYLNQSNPWVDLGFALAGVNGDPALVASGPLTADTDVVITLTNGLSSASATLVVGFSQLLVPFKGGVLVPSPDVLFAFGLDVGGGLNVTSPWPGGVPPGLELALQSWIVDPAGPKGLSASNGVVGTTP